jgi:hypothetical protein
VVNARLVRERDRRRGRELGLVLLILLPLGGALLVYTWIHLQVIGAGYEIRRLEARVEGLADQERVLLLEAARLESPRRLRDEATKLGLQRPAVEQFLFVEEARP